MVQRSISCSDGHFIDPESNMDQTLPYTLCCETKQEDSFPKSDVNYFNVFSDLDFLKLHLDRNTSDFQIAEC